MQLKFANCCSLLLLIFLLIIGIGCENNNIIKDSHNTFSNSNLETPYPINDINLSTPKSNAVDPNNLTNEWNLIVNTSRGNIKSFIEYDKFSNNFYTAHDFQNTSLTNNPYQLNFSKYDSNYDLIWNRTFFITNQTILLYEFLLSPNGTILYAILSQDDNIESYLFILSINSTDGTIIDQFKFKSSDLDQITGGVLTHDGYFLFLYGLSNPYPNEKLALWKINLFSEEIEWHQMYGINGQKYKSIDIQITDDGEYVYLLGYQELGVKSGYSIFLQYNSSGWLYNEFINNSISTQIPMKFIFNQNKTGFFVLVRETNDSFDELCLVETRLNGHYLNHTLYNNSYFVEPIINSMQYDDGNNSIYIAGSQKMNNINRAYIAQIDLNRNLIWENFTESMTTHEIYFDFAISSNNSRINLIGLCIKSFIGTCYYAYDLKNPPLAPFLFTDNRPCYSNQVNLMWTASNRADNYSIYRSNTPFSEIENADLVGKDITDLLFIDNIALDGLYYYRVVAVGLYGNSSLSNLLEILKTTNHTPYIFPILVENRNQIKLNWTGDEYFDQKYYIFRNESPIFNPELTTPLTEVTSPITGYIDFDVPVGIWYYGIIAMYNDGGYANSSLSNIQSIEVEPDPPVFVIEFNQTAPYVDEINITWSPLIDATEYAVYRLQGMIYDVNKHGPIQITTETSVIDNPKDDTQYYWVVIAYNGSKLLSQSNQISAFVFSPIMTPVITEPTSNITDGNIYFSWTPVPGALYYLVFSSLNPISTTEGLTPIATINNPQTYYSNFFPDVGNFYYVIIAGKMGLNSSMSNCILISIQHLPLPVTNISVQNGFIQGTNNEQYPIWIVKNQSVILEWNATNGSAAYKIYRSLSPMHTNNLFGATFLGITVDTSFFDGTVTDLGKFYYAIQSINGTGNSVVSILYNCYVEVYFLPDPVNLTASNPIDYKILLNWTQGNRNTVVYHLIRYHQPLNESNWDILSSNLSILNKWPNKTQFSYIDIDVPAGIWYYAIVAENIYGRSNVSNCVQVIVTNVPISPTVDTIETPNLSRNVTLSWNGISGATEYYIYRSFQPITNENIHLLNAINSTTMLFYTDVLVPGGFYYYAVRAFNTTGFSAISNVQYIEIRYVPQNPAWNMTRTNVIINRINFTWLNTDPYSKINGYFLARTETPIWDSNNAEYLAIYLTNSSFFFNLDKEGTYYYWIQAYNNSGPSFPTDPLNLTGYIMPSPVLTLISENPVLNNTIMLNWSTSNWAETYQIYKSMTPEIIFSPMYLYATVAANTTSFTDFNVPYGRYYYGILPISAFGPGDPSEILMVRVECRPPTPNLLSAVETNPGTFLVNWDPISGIDGYIVFVSRYPIVNEINFSVTTASPLLNSDMVNYTFSNLGVGSFYFVMVSVNGTGFSEISNVIIKSNFREPGLPENVITMIWVMSCAVGTLIGLVAFKLIRDRRNNPDRILYKYEMAVSQGKASLEEFDPTDLPDDQIEE
jgi:fibronectin type 3 domain-containing protein